MCVSLEFRRMQKDLLQQHHGFFMASEKKSLNGNLSGT